MEDRVVGAAQTVAVSAAGATARAKAKRATEPQEEDGGISTDGRAAGIEGVGNSG
jgi:hypothetical protein